MFSINSKKSFSKVFYFLLSSILSRNWVFFNDAFSSLFLSVIFKGGDFLGAYGIDMNFYGEGVKLNLLELSFNNPILVLLDICLEWTDLSNERLDKATRGWIDSFSFIESSYFGGITIVYF